MQQSSSSSTSSFKSTTSSTTSSVGGGAGLNKFKQMDQQAKAKLVSTDESFSSSSHQMLTFQLFNY